MPVRLDVDAELRVSDQEGRIIRHEVLPAGTDLRDRLRGAHESYQLQGWTVGELRAGQWVFIADKVGRRLPIAIRDASPATASAIEAEADRY
jgi:hypothetical protein